MSLASKVMQRRHELGLSQEELATRMGYSSRSSINKIENGRPVSQKIIVRLAEALDVSIPYLMEWEEVEMPVSVKAIPLLGNVSAGMPISRIENESEMMEMIPSSWAGEYFALKIKGDSMEPRIKSGDIVIVKCQEDAEDGDVVIAAVNGDEATCKRLRKFEGSIMLQPDNPAYIPIVWDGRTGPAITIIGKVVELRCRF